MSTYKIFIHATVSSEREVEADSLQEAQEKALDDAPYAPGFSDYEFDEWDVSGDYYLDGKYVAPDE